MAYLLKASAVLVIFYFSYKWLLQRETFFNANRWFLLIGQFLALVFPLVVIPIYVETSLQPLDSAVIPNISTNTQLTTETISIKHILYWTYGLGVLIFFGKFIIRILSLVKLLIGKASKKLSGIHYVETADKLAVFSFFNWVVYNPKSYKKEELQLILNHERVHVNQWHSIDVIISEIACIMFWFNPIMWLYKKALQQNLEFIADKHTQLKSDCQKSYQRLLLKASIPSNQLVMANNFYNSLIKNRIVMLNKSKSKTIKHWKHFLVIPILAVFLMSFNTKTIYVVKNTSLQSTFKKTFIVSANTSHSELKSIESYFKNKAVRVKFTDVLRNTNNTIEEISIKTKYDTGTTYIKRVTVRKDASETIEPFKLTLSEDEKDILFQYANDEATRVSQNTISFGKNATVGTRLRSKRVLDEDDGLGKNPLYIINGKHYRKDALKKQTYKIDGSITTINKKEGLERYGEAGKDGVLIFNGKSTIETNTHKKK